MKNQFVINALVLIIGALLGFAAAEATIVMMVSRHDTQIQNTDKSLAMEVAERREADAGVQRQLGDEHMALQQQMSDDRAHVDKAMTELLQDVRTVIEQNTHAFALWEAQRQDGDRGRTDPRK